MQALSAADAKRRSSAIVRTQAEAAQLVRAWCVGVTPSD